MVVATRSVLCLLFVSLWAASPAQASTRDEAAFYETNVRPLLVQRCGECHGEKLQRGGLRLDTPSGITNGGESGEPLIDRESPEQSLLLRVVRRDDVDFAMPPESSAALTADEIATLSEWLARGGKMPTESTMQNVIRRDRNHWSFSPLQSVEVPSRSDDNWSSSPIDRLVWDQLREHQMSPNVRADRRELLRRLTFDLTGLPPTPAEVDAFVADRRPDAWIRVVDRLLATPAYGERMGRRWLDVVRYADSNGLDENVAHGNAWRYRDYIVTSFNADRPYTTLIREQVAGDLLPAESDELRATQLIATGFLALGPKVLAEADKVKLQMDIVDEQIDTTSRVFLGMTFGCARCHDHKFDPIDQSDYYALAGVFKSTRTMESLKTVARWNENELPSAAFRQAQAEHMAALTKARTELDEHRRAAEAAYLVTRSSAQPIPDTAEAWQAVWPDDVRANLATLAERVATLESQTPTPETAMGVGEDQVTNVAIHWRGNPQTLGPVVPRHVPTILRPANGSSFPPDQSGRLELANWLIAPDNPLTARVLVNRIWRWYLGHGLVRSTDNFGVLGDRPSHPRLLDWLARRIQRDDWSLKHFQRLLLTSQVYQQVARPSTTLDPENRWFSYFSPRRLEAEEVRDAMLAVGGMLDQSLGGSLLKTPNRAFLFDHTSKDTTDYTSRRRTLYLPIIRNHPCDLLQLFDFPDAAVSQSDRVSTVVAPQALMLLNSSFVLECADQVAQRVGVPEFPRESPRPSIDRVYRLMLGRVATAEEQTIQVAYLQRLNDALAAEIPDETARRFRSWSIFCHTLLISNEFLYLH